MNNKQNYAPFMKKFYRISKERLEAYLNRLEDVSEIMRKIRPEGNKGKVDWEKVNEAWMHIIDVGNGLYGYKNYEDYKAGGELIDDAWINWSGFDESKFFSIEFPDGIEKQPKPITDKK